MRRFGPIAGITVISLMSCHEDGPLPLGPPGPSDAELRGRFENWGVIPLAPPPPQNPAQVALGRALFFDKILSGNRDVACATCHDPMTSLSDGLSLSIGTGGSGRGPDRVLGPGRRFVPRSAPSLLNSGLGLRYVFWDGRLTEFRNTGQLFTQPDTIFFPDVSNVLTAQATLPVLQRVEMRGIAGDVDVHGGANELAAIHDDQPAEIWDAIMRRLLAIPEYVRMLEAANPGTDVTQLRYRHAAEAIAAFQIEQFTRINSPFDRFLASDGAALTDAEKRGAALFLGDALCIHCHNGPLLGGRDFANVGAPQIGPGVRQALPLDLGRGELNTSGFYQFEFRVSPLRNVELTAPYMHSGAYGTLEAVVEHYNDAPTAMRKYDVTQLAPAFRDSYHGDPGTIDAMTATLDHRVDGELGLAAHELRDLVAFLKSLTDPTARNLRSLIPADVPSGLPVR